MAKKQIRIWVDIDTLGRLKKGAVNAGTSLSDFANTIFLRGFEAECFSESNPGSEIKALLASGLREVTSEIRSLERALPDMRGREQDPGQPSGYPWTKDQVRHLVYIAARLDKFFTVYNADWGRNDANVGTRARVANEAGDRAIQKFGLKEDEHAR